MADTQWLTQAQYDLLASELKERIEVKRVEIARLIDAARQEGDLRENGGYHAARNEQSMNETRIQALQEMLEHAEVGETPADDGIVEPGMVVTALVAGREQKFLLGSRDAGGDLGIQVFSVPIAAFINATVMYLHGYDPMPELATAKDRPGGPPGMLEEKIAASYAGKPDTRPYVAREESSEDEVVASVDLHVEARVESEGDATQEETSADENQKPGEPPTPHVEA